MGVGDAQVVDEGDHGIGEDEGEVGVVLDREALELGSGTGKHLLGTLDLVVHVGRLGTGGRREHALEAVLDVIGGQRRTVMALDAVLELAVQGDAVCLEAGDLGQQAGDELVVLGPAQGRLEDGVGDGGGGGVGGLLHVQTLLGVGLTELQDLLGGLGGSRVATAGGECRRGSRTAGSERGRLQEATACEVLHHGSHLSQDRQMCQCNAMPSIL